VGSAHEKRSPQGLTRLSAVRMKSPTLERNGIFVYKQFAAQATAGIRIFLCYILSLVALIIPALGFYIHIQEATKL
jgi:hypothetical protein